MRLRILFLPKLELAMMWPFEMRILSLWWPPVKVFFCWAWDQIVGNSIRLQFWAILKIICTSTRCAQATRSLVFYEVTHIKVESTLPWIRRTLLQEHSYKVLNVWTLIFGQYILYLTWYYLVRGPGKRDSRNSGFRQARRNPCCLTRFFPRNAQTTTIGGSIRAMVDMSECRHWLPRRPSFEVVRLLSEAASEACQDYFFVWLKYIPSR